MALKVGIVGLPNVGKSTLFNALTKAHVEASNYSFATIKPNDGVIEVPDERLDYLVSVFKPKKTVHATIEFSDMAGLAKGASSGAGLGNKFLAHIRECAMIVEVIRFFENSEVIHSEVTIDPLRDFEIINLELMMADLETLDARIAKIETKAKVSKEKDLLFELNTLKLIHQELSKGNYFYKKLLSTEQLEFAFQNLHLLSLKDLLVVANLGDNEIARLDTLKSYNDLKDYLATKGVAVIPICAKLEEDLLDFSDEEKSEFLMMNNLSLTGLENLVKTAYKSLGLATFFTVGGDECKAWTFKLGMKAPDAAAVIHTDFKRGFIKAEVYAYQDFVLFPNETKLKEQGKIRIEGKEYVVKDGDIIFFRFNVGR
ncbi:MAG: redox-regulated ATPase YchF [Erysipelotrichaceae bacterium]|jgi:GTP-binding protein YchF|nr:redox-regulated ATPase YchF [Erysipelotrichaceae bacterium]